MPEHSQEAGAPPQDVNNSPTAPGTGDAHRGVEKCRWHNAVRGNGGLVGSAASGDQVSTPTRPAPKPPAQPVVNYLRNFPLEDLSIKPGDGRTVEAYCAVFDVPAEIRDQDGHYLEVVDRDAFSRAIHDTRPAGGREAWKTGVFFNHGRDLSGAVGHVYDPDRHMHRHACR